MSAEKTKQLNKVLLVEDDFASSEIIKNSLEKHKREYIHVTDGASAIESCRDNPDINLILMDIRLPILDGIKAMQEIKKINNDVKVIAQTAYFISAYEDKNKYIASGFDDFIEKPFHMSQLSEIITKYS